MSAPFRIRPFDFGTAFEATISSIDQADAAELRLRLVALEAELALVRCDADGVAARIYGEGYEAGLARAREDQTATLLVAADALHAAVEEIDDKLEAITDVAAAAAAGVAMAAAELIAGRALTDMPVATIDEAIGRALRQIARGQEVCVVVHPTLVDAVEALIATRQAADRRRLALVAVGDPALALGDAHIRWDQGGVVLDAAARTAAVRAALAGALPSGS